MAQEAVSAPVAPPEPTPNFKDFKRLLMGTSPRPDSDSPDLTRQAAPVDRLLSEAGRTYRRAAEKRTLSPHAVQRIRVALLAAAEPKRGASTARPFSLTAGLRALVRPAAFALVGATAAVAVILWVGSPRIPSATVVYPGGGNGLGSGVETAAVSEPLPVGETLIAHDAPGTMLQIDDQTRVYLRPDAAVEVAAGGILALKSGEIWVSHPESAGKLIVLTPQGKVIPEGTVFGVCAGSPLTGEFRVTVYEGAVNVSRHDHTSRVEAGTRLDWSRAVSAPTIVRTSVRVPAWAERLIDSCRTAFLQTASPGSSRT